MEQKRPKLDAEKVDEINDDACYIKLLPNEIIEKIFSHLTQNQLGQIARVCRRWSVLTKSQVLWKRVDVAIFTNICSSDKEKNAVVKSFIDGLPFCVTFIRIDLCLCDDLDFEELCMKLHQNCPHLEVLIVKCGGTTTTLPEVINTCTRFLLGLKKLVFLYCLFRRCSETVELIENSIIEVLDLNCSPISKYRKIQFSKLLSLRELRLAETDVNDAWFVGANSLLNQLHVLDLGRTNITATTFLAIQRHGQNLRELYLCNLRLWDTDFDFHNPLFPHLNTICFGDTHMTCEGLASLVLSCPSLVNVYVKEDVARSFARHPFVATSRCRSGIVKSIIFHLHSVRNSYN